MLDLVGEVVTLALKDFFQAITLATDDDGKITIDTNSLPSSLVSMSPENLRDGGQLELGQDESNRFYDCIEFYQNGEEFIAKNPERLQELMDMDFEALEEYVCRNNYDWTGDDFDHMEEYLVFVSEMQDEWQFIRGEVCNDSEYMEIIKQPWIRDKVKGYKSDNRFELAYLILLENAVITAETRERLDAVGVV